MERNEAFWRSLVQHTHFEKIHNNLNMDDEVVAFLMAKGILTFDRGHEFLSADQSRPKEYKTNVRNLISALCKGGVYAIPSFVYALRFKSQSTANREIGDSLTESAIEGGAPFDFDSVTSHFHRQPSSEDFQQLQRQPSSRDPPRDSLVTVQPEQEDNTGHPVAETKEPGSKEEFLASTPRPVIFSPTSESKYAIENRLITTATDDGDDELALEQVVMENSHPLVVPSEHAEVVPAYPISNHRCGFAWIFNVSKFASAEIRERAGSAADCRRLQQTFPLMQGLLTHIEQDPTAACIRQRLRELATSELSGKHDVTVVAVLSHSTRAQVYGSDGALVPIRDIMAQFNEENAPNLAGKPKVFIIQGCHGVSNDSGEDGELQRQLSDLRDDGSVERISRMTPLTDMILAYSTLPGHLHWQRSQHETSPFIDALTQETLKSKQHKNFAQIATTVANTLANQFPTAPHCLPLSGLRKPLYFR